jgi:signal transduction histidine kinase
MAIPWHCRYNNAVPCLASLLLRVLALALATGAAAAAAAPPLWTAAQVRALTSDETQQRPPLTLRGVVTYCRHADTSDFTVQDATGGVWLPEMPLPAGCRPGAEVEITGHAEPGVFGAIVRADSLRVLGHGRLPEALPVSYEELLAVRLNSQRVKLIGVVRSQRINAEFGLGWLALELASGGGRVTLNLTHEIVGHPELVGARVSVLGVCLHSPDSRAQEVFLPTLNVRSLDDIVVLSPGEARPFDLPVVPMNQILRPTSRREPSGLVHVRGIVTLVPPVGPLAVQDATRGLRVWLRESPLPHPGEQVDIAGFPEPGAYSPVLRDAAWQPVGKLPPPAPLTVDPPDATTHEGRLLTVRGILQAAARGENQWTLTLENGQVRFLARIYDAHALPWRIGSALAVSGVCDVEVGSWEAFVTHRRPQGFSLQVGNFADVRLLSAPSWWSAWRLFAILTAVLVVTLSVLWVRTRRRLREERRGRERARALFAAVFGERNRMAGEIHDTLAQGFASISVQLEALGDRLGVIPDSTRRHLDLARQLVRQSLAEARRSVWGLRPQVLEEGSLGSALAQIGRHLTEGSTITFEMRATGTPRPLPAQLEHDLLRIGQEALTNAVRHAGASRLELALDFQQTAVCLTVTDDGSGLPAAPPAHSNGGFGLPGMRARASAIHAVLHLRSTPGAGTIVELTIPHA